MPHDFRSQAFDAGVGDLHRLDVRPRGAVALVVRGNESRRTLTGTPEQARVKACTLTIAAFTLLAARLG